MPGQWEFQIGYRTFDGEVADPLTMSDHVWLAFSTPKNLLKNMM